MSEMIYKAGDSVPREWFSKLENVIDVSFRSDVVVTMTDGIRYVLPTSGGPFDAVIFFDGIPGTEVVAHFDPETHVSNRRDETMPKSNGDRS